MSRSPARAGGPHKRWHSLRQQQGAALLLALVVLVSVASYAMLKALHPPVLDPDAERYRRTQDLAVLEEARAALLAYAVSYPERNGSPKGPGRLPCPIREDSYGGSDVANSNCSLGGAPIRGRLPYRELGYDAPFVDSAGEPLWYALAPSHVYTRSVVNSDTGDASDALSVDGQSDVLAVLIAAGPPLPGQDRSAVHDASAFLDGVNGDSDPLRYSRGTGPAANDTVVTIDRTELNRLMEQRVGHSVEAALRRASLLAAADPTTPGLFEQLLGSLGATLDDLLAGLFGGGGGGGGSVACHMHLVASEAAALPGCTVTNPRIPQNVMDALGLPCWLNEWAGHVRIGFDESLAGSGACTSLPTVAVCPRAAPGPCAPGSETIVTDAAYVVAVAGRALPGQSARSPSATDLTQWFEDGNADSNPTWLDSPPGTGFNDVVPWARD